jgi:hypothetical protein
MSKHEDTNRDFEYNGSAPTDVEYVQERPVRSGKYSATAIVTTSLLVAGGIVGGAAFAITHAPQSASPATPVVDASSSASPSAVAASPTPSTSPSGLPGKPHKFGKTISVPPAAFDDKDGGRDFHSAPKPGATNAPTPGATPSSLPSAPTFGGGGHDGDHGFGDDHHKRDHGFNPNPDASGAPTAQTNQDN